MWNRHKVHLEKQWIDGEMRNVLANLEEAKFYIKGYIMDCNGMNDGWLMLF